MENKQLQQNDVEQTLNQENHSLKTRSSSINTNKPKQRETQKAEGSSTFDATVNILKCGLGTGILFLPFVFMDCGIVLSTFLMILTGFVCYFCWIILSKVICCQENFDRNDPNNQNLTLESIFGIILSKNSKIFIEIITIIYSFGTCLGYSVFIRSSTQNITSNPYYIILIMFAIYLPLSLFKQIQNLAVFNKIALAALLFTIGCIIFQSIYQLDSYDGNFPTYKMFEFSRLPLYFGVFTFAYDINGVITEVHASMKDKSQFNIVLKSYLILSCLLGITVGILGYVAFGNNIDANIFMNIGEMNGFRDVLTILFSLALIASILLYCFHIGYQVDNFIKTYIFKNNSEETNIIQMILTRTGIFFSFTILSIYIDNIIIVFNLLGCIFCTILTYIAPIILLKKAQTQEYLLFSLKNWANNQIIIDFQNQNELKSQQNFTIKQLPKGKLINLICFIVLLFGIGGGISGIVQTIIEIKKK